MPESMEIPGKWEFPPGRRAEYIEYGIATVGIPTGFFDLDYLIGGLCCGDLIVLASQHRSIATAIAKKFVGKWTIYFDRKCTLSAIAARARRLERPDGEGLVVVDFSSLVGNRCPHGDYRKLNVDAARKMKLLAVQLYIPVLCFLWLPGNRDKADSTLRDVRRYGRFDQVADTVILLNRAPKHDSENGEQEKVDLIIPKNSGGPIEPLLAPDFHYASQFVFDEIKSKDEYLAYIRPKLETIRQSDSPVWAEIGELTEYPGGPCVVLAQGDRNSLVSTVLLEVAGGLISRIDQCIVPPPTAARRSGEYPE